MFLSRRHRLLFVHIPKTAGSAITDALERLDPSALTSLPFARRTKHLTAREIAPRAALLGLPLSRLYVFAVVRNPYERFASLYHYLRKREKYVERMAAYPRLDDFAAAVAAREPWTERLHSIRPQADFVLAADGRALVGNVVRYEALGEGLAAVERHLGRPLDLQVRNASDWSRTDADRLISPAVRDLVRERYATDFATFGYPVD
jgi:hypothetical protein